MGMFGLFECLFTLSSWGLSYNLYADKLLGTNVFPESVYDMRKVVLGVTAFHTHEFVLIVRDRLVRHCGQ